MSTTQTTQSPKNDTLPPPARAAKMFSLVERIASRFARRVPAHIELDDLVGAGSLGLAEAYERRGSMPGDEFETFAACRVRGAILDELRRLDHLSRRMRHTVRRLDEASHDAAQKGADAPVDAEVAAKVGIKAERHRKIMLRQSMEIAQGADAHAVADTTSPSPESLVEAKDLVEKARAGIAKLPARMQFVLEQRYTCGASQREVADMLGVTESRVSQLHTRAMKELAALVAEPELLAA